MNKIYMEVTLDKYELPLAVADSAEELSRMTGYSSGVILSAISHCEHGRRKKSRFHRVTIDEGDENQCV